MKNALLRLYVWFECLRHDEKGQDLVEYALLVSLIALACVAGLNTIATAVNNIFTKISTSLA